MNTMQYKERSIIMMPMMSAAIMDDRKTQARRPVKLGWPGTFGPSDTPSYDWHFRGNRRGGYCPAESCWQDYRTANLLKRLSPYGTVGDRLWVREAWRAVERADGCDGILYRADDSFVPIRGTREAADAWIAAYDNGRYGKRWRSPVHMPRWASRITLEITDVRIEQLQCISRGDAAAEGVIWNAGPLRYGDTNPISAFHRLWDQINGTSAPWESNPWVWVIEFKRIEVAR